MNKMTDYRRFLGKPEDYNIDGEVVTVHNLTTKDTELFMDLSTTSKRQDATTQLILKSLKDDTLKVEDVDQWKSGIRSKFIEKIMIANGYGDELENAKERLTSGQSKPAPETKG